MLYRSSLVSDYEPHLLYEMEQTQPSVPLPPSAFPGDAQVICWLLWLGDELAQGI